MPANFSGTWVSYKHEGWGAVVDFLKVDPSKLPESNVVTETITQDGDTIKIVSSHDQYPDVKKELAFRVGETFTDNFMGKPYECHTAWEGDQLVLTGTSGNGGGVRKMVGDGMVMTLRFGSNEATTWFKKK